VTAGGPTPYPRAARALLRETLLDAVDALIRHQGWAATSVAAVASRAGVSRQTVYNEFGSRQGVAEAYVRREIDGLVARVDAAVREHADDPQAALRSAFALFLHAASDEPLVKTLTAHAEGADLLALLTSVGRAVAVEHLSGLITELWPQVSRPEAAILADTLARLGISHAVFPTGPAEAAADEVSRLLGPFVAAVTG
jgi:AcrR family transcriptional regulator